MRNLIFITCLVIGLVGGSFFNLSAEDDSFHAWLVDTQDLPSLKVAELQKESVNKILVSIQRMPTHESIEALLRLKEAGLGIGYWIEVARDPDLANAHPEWMASIQGHPEWRRFYPEFPKETEDQIVKVYPWVPIFYEGAFEAQLAKVSKLLKSWPSPERLFLNGLQGAPSACGCGHPLCRWTTDYGPKRTAQELGHDAPARFVEKVQESFPHVECIPIWVSECEAHDKDGWCAGVGCYNGACWREWSRQLDPLAAHSRHLGALLTYKELGRDLKHYSEEAGWIASSIQSFRTEMKRYDRPEIDPKRLFAVLQGWDVSSEQIAAQIRLSKQAGTAGYVIAKTPILSGWEPKLVPIKTFP